MRCQIAVFGSTVDALLTLPIDVGVNEMVWVCPISLPIDGALTLWLWSAWPQAIPKEWP